MPTPYDVPPSLLIERLAKYLRDNIDEIKPPDWALYTKTGAHTEKSPDDPAWWFTRSASLLRKIYLKGPIGIEHLRAEYGGRKDKGTRPEHAKKGSGAVIRRILEHLETARLVEKSKRGRILSRKGRQLLDRISTEISDDLEKVRPELKKY